MIIYAIPGLGTTEKLYINTVINGTKPVVLEWPEPSQNDTMASYARKFLPQIDTSQPFCLLGVSFGGMLCTELSALLAPEKVFLISTSKSRAELPWFIKMFKYFPVYQYISEARHRKMAYQGRWVIGFGRAYKPEFLEMINSMAGNYFKYSIDMIVKWNGTRLPSHAVHIHGTADRLLLYRGVKANHAVKGGSHAMVLFRAEEINRIIEGELKKIALSANQQQSLLQRA